MWVRVCGLGFRVWRTVGRELVQKLVGPLVLGLALRALQKCYGRYHLVGLRWHGRVS